MLAGEGLRRLVALLVEDAKDAEEYGCPGCWMEGADHSHGEGCALLWALALPAVAAVLDA